MNASKQNALQLIEQMLDKAIIEDVAYKKKKIKLHEASRAIGESELIYQLKTLKEAVENIN